MDLVELDLGNEIAEFEEKKPWPQGRYSRTLLKRPAVP